jgi:hypothetical protein
VHDMAWRLGLGRWCELMGQHYHARLGGKVMCIVETSLVCGLFNLVCWKTETVF